MNLANMGPEGKAQEGPHDAGVDGRTMTARQQALARLAATRSRLRAQVVPARSKGLAAEAPGGPGLRTWWRFLRRELGHSPVGLAVLSWVERWWQRQPLSAVAEIGAAELRTMVLPVVRRHPVAALTGAALLGGALVAARRRLWSWAGQRTGAWRGSLGAWIWQQARDPALQLLVMTWVQQLAAARSAAEPAKSPMSEPGPAAAGASCPPSASAETGG